jgi:hypothetical protein
LLQQSALLLQKFPLSTQVEPHELAQALLQHRPLQHSPSELQNEPSAVQVGCEQLVSHRPLQQR